MNSLSLAQQLLSITNSFSTDETSIKYPYLIVNMKIKPTEFSPEYPILIKYHDKKEVEVWVTGYLKKMDDPNFPHHYGFDKKKERVNICLYLPKNNEWNSSYFLTETIIPWTSEWLFFYELWLGTGEWYGGGEHPELNN